MNIGDYWWLIVGIVIIIALVVILIVLKTQLNKDKQLLDQANAQNDNQQKEEESKQEETTEPKQEEVKEVKKSSKKEAQEDNKEEVKEDEEIDFIPVETESKKKSKKKVSNEQGATAIVSKSVEKEEKESEETTLESTETVDTKEEKKEGETKVTAKTAEKYRVTYDKDKKDWVVKKDGAQRATKRFATKEEATAFAKEIAKNHDSGLAIHKKNGKFQKKN